MLDRVWQTVRRYRLLEDGDIVVVGVSGGPDSLALLHSLMALQKEFGYSVHAAHLNHGLRPEAAADAKYVCHIVKGWGLPVTVASRDVMAYQSKHHLSLEAAAREVRYSFLREVATGIEATKIAVGHQADDQAETVVLNLLRGSGLTGLKAMVPHRGKLIRPLLFISRAEIEAYCSEHGIKTLQDFTNTDQVYRRNKIRHLLLPLLAREFNPAIISTLSRTAVILQEEEELLVKLAEDAFSRVKVYQDTGNLILNRQEWLALDLALQRRVLRRAAAAMGRKVNFNQAEAAREVISRGGSLTWPENLRVSARGAEIIVQIPASTSSPGSVSYQLQVPGLTPLPELGQAIRAELTDSPVSFQGKDDEAWLDWAKMEKPVIVRNWQPGDYFRPLGMAGKKKIQDFFTDIHLPPARRHLVPLVVSGKHIIAWIAGLRLADDFKITAATRVALHLKLESWG